MHFWPNLSPVQVYAAIVTSLEMNVFNLCLLQGSSSSSNYLFLVQQKNKLYNKVTRK